MNLFNSKYILSEQRHTWVDYSRGISIILVTYRHCYEGMMKSGINMKLYPVLEYINLFFFGFRMPLFFIISGAFISSGLNKKGIKGYSKNRLQSILYPMVIWGIIQITLQILFSKYANSKTTAISYLYLFTDPRSTGQFWYLNALFCVSIIYAFLKNNIKLKIQHQLILGILLFFSSNYINTNELYLGLLIDIFKFYIFFSIGDAFSNFLLSERSAALFNNKYFFIGTLVTFIIVQCFFTFYNLKAGNDYFVETNMPLFFFFAALIGTTFVVSICFLLSKSGRLSKLRVIGYNSINIFCLQIIIMSVVRQIVVKVFHLDNIPALTLIIVTSGLILPVLFYNIFLRMKLWWLFSLKKPKQEINALTTIS